MSSPQIHPTLAAALSARGYDTLTPVQLAVLEPETLGRDLLVSARTGSGKTVAYGLVLAQTLLADGVLVPAGAPSALVIAPTRRTRRIQVQSELQWLYAGARVASCVGGMDPRAERRALDQGFASIVAAVRPAVRATTLSVAGCAWNISAASSSTRPTRCSTSASGDELDGNPRRDRAQEPAHAAALRATLPKVHRQNLAGAYQHDALRLTVGAGANRPTATSTLPRHPHRAATRSSWPRSTCLRFFDSSAAMIFCATRDGVRKLHANLVERGFCVVALSGELTQAQRSHALQALRDRRAIRN